MRSSPQDQKPEPSVLNDEVLQLFLAMRQSYLMQVDALERVLKISPTTADIRRLYKEGKIDPPKVVEP